MKRLLATAGCPRAIYQVSRVFRRDEQGPLHNPEFTLVEWYRQGDSLDRGMDLPATCARRCLGRGPALRLSYREAFRQYAGVDPHAATTAELIAAAQNSRVPSPPPESLAADDRDGWLDWLLTERVQPHLGTRAAGVALRLSGHAGRLGAGAAGQSAAGGAVRACTSPASSWPTATRSCSMRRVATPQCGGQRPASGGRQAAACRSRAGFWRPWRPVCRRRSAWRWDWIVW